MTTEEIGDDPAILAAMAAKGSNLHQLCPPPTSATTLGRLATLAAVGVQIRTLQAPYVHAKTLITPSQAFLGSQNLSAVSLQDNREMGILVNGPTRTALANSDLAARLKIGAQLNPAIRRHSTGAMPMSHRFP